MKVYQDISQLVGNTPVVSLCCLAKAAGAEASLFGKLEGQNPGGSAKDRVGFHMLKMAAARGQITKNTVVIEPTSGNTGIGLAIAARQMGVRLLIVMPDSMSAERRALMTAYGAELVLTPGEKGMAGAIEKAEELKKQYTDSYIPNQFSNKDNADVHYATTAPEIWRDLDGKVDIFVAGVGTGGTISGCGRFFKEQNRPVTVVGVEPFESQVLAGKPAGAHLIQGIGANFVPQGYCPSVVDEVLPVKGEKAIEMMRLLAETEGHLCGVSSGAAVAAAVCLARRPENRGKNIVALLPDRGERYLSMGYFSK